jgi:signal transduction histidine kinase
MTLGFRSTSADVRFRIVTLWVAYAALFGVFHAVLNDFGVVFLLVPALATAWMFGMRGALVAVLVMWPLQVVLFLASDHRTGIDMFAGWDGLLGLGVITVLALLTGWASSKVKGLTRLHRAKDHMVATVSHEVRNPLTGVLGMAELLSTEWETLSEADRREFAGRIVHQAREATEIIEDLLIVARMGSGAELKVMAERVDLAAVAGTAVARASEPVMLVADPSMAIADGVRARQVVTNLVSNSVKYGGTDRRLVVGSDGGRAWVEMRDDGPGVDPEVLEGLFEPFVAADHREATGIGLAVSRALARAMGGDLVYRREGGWTIFRLDLPAAPAVEPTDLEANRPVR